MTLTSFQKFQGFVMQSNFNNIAENCLCWVNIIDIPIAAWLNELSFIFSSVIIWTLVSPILCNANTFCNLIQSDTVDFPWFLLFRGSYVTEPRDLVMLSMKFRYLKYQEWPWCLLYVVLPWTNLKIFPNPTCLYLLLIRWS